MSAFVLKRGRGIGGMRVHSLVPQQDPGRFSVQTKMENQHLEAILSNILTGHIYCSQAHLGVLFCKHFFNVK